MAFEDAQTKAARPFIGMILSYMASSGSLIIVSAAQLATFAILARFLGVNQFGLFVGVTAIANIAVHLCGVGAMECLVRRVARDRSIYPVMLGHNIILTAISGTVLVAIGMIALPFFFTLADDPVLNVVTIGLMLVTNIFLVRLIVLTEQIFIAHTNFVSANTVVISFALVRTVAAVLACLVFGVATVHDWAIWQFAAHLLMAGACFIVLRRLGKPRFMLVREELPQGLFFSLPFILRAIQQNADLLVLSLVATTEIVGSYSVARRMLESSYLSVEALNRLIYPGSARASADGIHNLFDRVRKVLLAAFMIAVLAACALYVLAPLLPYLFGHDYINMVGFVRTICWVVIPLAVWSVAAEALGASGHHAARATVLSTGSLLGAAAAAFGSWYAPPLGTFVAFYLIESSMVVATWSVLVRLVRRDQREADRQSGADTQQDTAPVKEQRETMQQYKGEAA